MISETNGTPTQDEAAGAAPAPPVPGAVPGTPPEADALNAPADVRPAPEPTADDLARARFLEVTAGENPLDRVGDALADLRQALGFTIQQVKEATLIREDFLSNLEAMNVKALPASYVPRYLANYARFLGLEPGEVVRRYEMQCGALSEAPKVQIDTTPRARLKAQVQWVSAGAAVVLGGLVTVMFTLQVFARPGDELGDLAMADEAAGASAQLGSDVLGDPVRLAQIDASVVAPPQLRVLRKGWIEVRGADGTVFRDRVMAAGEVLTLRAGAGWSVTVLDGGAFEWVRGEEVIGPLGEDGVKAFSVGVDEVLARHEEAKRKALEEAAKASARTPRTVTAAPPR